MTSRSRAPAGHVLESYSTEMLHAPAGAAGLVAPLRRMTPLEWITVLAACASPLLLLLGTGDWLLTGPNYIDPWQYLGFFYHYTNPDYAAGHYKLARLPWILSGWLVHRVSSGVTAAYLLHAIFLVASGCGFFVLLRALFGNFRLALLGAMLLGFHVPFHGSGSWDYHNTAAGAFYIWALAAVTLAAIKEAAQRAVLSGVATALAVHSNITYGVFVPLLVVHYLFVYRAVAGHFPSRRSLANAVIWSALGAVGITALLSAINLMVGREALFFAKLLNITLRYTADTGYLTGWWHPWSSGWFWRSRHLALATAMVLLSPTVFIPFRRSGQAAGMMEQLVTVEFLVMAAIWTAWQFAGNLTLEWDYFMYPLQPHVILALMALASVWLPTVPAYALVLTPVLLLLPLALGFGPSAASIPSTRLVQSTVAAIVCFVLAGTAVWTRSALGTLAFVSLFSIGNTLLADNHTYSARGACHDRADAYTALVSANLFVAAADPSLVRTRLWFDEAEPPAKGCPLTIGQVGYSLAGFGMTYLMNPFPMPSLAKIPDDVLRRAADDNLAIVTISPGAVRQFEQRALQTGLDALPIASRRFSVGDGGFEVTLLRLRESPEHAHRIAQLPGGTIADWSREKLRTILEINTYALPRREVLQYGSAGELVFSPATRADHLATPLVPVPASVDARALLVAAAPDATRDVNCTMFVQDQRLHVLAVAPCGDLSLAVDGTFVPLPADVTAVRIFFRGETKTTIMLPSRLRISYHHGATAR
jgi:hypothetical protein